MVGIDFVASDPRGALGRFARKLAGFDGALPDNYGRTHSDLASYLNTLKRKYTATTST
jgi:hypothetical protein